MKRWLLPLLALAAFAALLYYVVGVDKTKPAAGEKPKLLQIEAAAVKEISLSNPETKLRFVRRPEEGFTWWLEPQHLPANDTRLEYLLNTLADLEGTPLKMTGAETKAFGLDRPTWRVELSLGQETQVLLVGAAVPVTQAGGEKSYYAQVSGRPQVYTIAGWVVDQFEGKVEDWRERYLAELPTADVAAVEVTWDGERLAARKEGERWLLSAPRQKEADAAKVRTLINRVGFMEAREFVTDNPTPQELAAWGLDKPWLRAVIATAGQKPLRRELVIGGKTNAKTMYYAKLADHPWVFLVETRSVEELEAAARDLLKCWHDKTATLAN